MNSIRNKYDEYGVKNFYSFHGKDYINPHEKQIRESIKYIYNNWDLNFSKVLDLACGNGEVTKILMDLKVNNIKGLDAYLSKEYIKKTGKFCYDMSFDEIIKGNLKDKFSLIICSYALHLLEISKLPIFMYRMSEITNNFIIISPHKRPIIRNDWGWSLENETIIDRVKIRHFLNNI